MDLNYDQHNQGKDAARAKSILDSLIPSSEDGLSNEQCLMWVCDLSADGAWLVPFVRGFMAGARVGYVTTSFHDGVWQFMWRYKGWQTTVSISEHEAMLWRLPPAAIGLSHGEAAVERYKAAGTAQGRRHSEEREGGE